MVVSPKMKACFTIKVLNLRIQDCERPTYLMLARETFARTFASRIRFLARTCSFCVRTCMMLPLRRPKPHLFLLQKSNQNAIKYDEINYHYLMVEIRRRDLKATMNPIEIKDGVPTWTQPDSSTISAARPRSDAKETRQIAEDPGQLADPPSQKRIETGLRIAPVRAALRGRPASVGAPTSF